MSDTVGDALPREMARVRDKVMPAYLAVPTGRLGAELMRHDLDLAAKALAEGDVVAMVRMLNELREWEA